METSLVWEHSEGKNSPLASPLLNQASPGGGGGGDSVSTSVTWAIVPSHKSHQDRKKKKTKTKTDNTLETVNCNSDPLEIR